MLLLPPPYAISTAETAALVNATPETAVQQADADAPAIALYSAMADIPAVQSSGVYTVSTTEELADALTAIAAAPDTEATIYLAADITAPFTDENGYKSVFDTAGKHITVCSVGEERRTLSLPYRCVLAGSCTFDNVTVSGTWLYCNGFPTVFTKNCNIYLGNTLYGGGYKTTVASTYVVLAATGSINSGATGGTHNVIGGSYQGSVEGDTYLEISGSIQFTGGNHLNPGCVMGDGTSGDGKNSPNVYVGGNATLVYDNANAKTSPAIEGSYGCEMRGNVTLDVRSGRANEICGQNEYADPSAIHGDLHIIAGAEAYENTDRALRLNGNWPIVGAGNSFAASPFETGTYVVNGNITIDTYENVWGWDKGTDPSYDIPEIYGAIDGDVGGNITINAHGSHMENITGAESSTVGGNVTINADNVELKNSYYETEYDEGDIFANYSSTVAGTCTINLNGGDTNIIRLTNYKTVHDGSAINITGSPKIRTGVVSTSNYSASPATAPTVTLHACTAEIPFIQSAAQVNVTDNSDVQINGLWLVRDLNVEAGSTLKSDDEDTVELEGSAAVNGTWEQLYHAAAAPEYALTIDGSLQVGANGQFLTQGSADICGSVANAGIIALMQPSYFEDAYIGTNAELRLPAVAANTNYTASAIPLRIGGLSSGTTTVNTVAPGDWQTLQTPAFGDNYILSRKNGDAPAQDTFLLGNADALQNDLYLKRVPDADGTDDYHMWQVASGITVTFDKNGGDTEASPRTVRQDRTEGQTIYHFALPDTAPTLADATFDGWNTKPDGSGAWFTERTDVTESMTVYAQWDYGTVSITPMDVTIYIGGDGYKGVIGNDGQMAVNDLPEIGYYVVLPDSINQMLDSTATNPIDLSGTLDFTYDDGNGTTRRWAFTLYGDNEHSFAMTTDGRSHYIYKMMPSSIDGSTTETVPVRLQFTASDGSVMVDSEFPVSATDQFRNYKISFYSGNLDQGKIRARFTIGGKTVLTDVAFGEGTLKVRGNYEEKYTRVDYGTPTPIADDPERVLAGTMQADTRYFINDSNVEVNDTDAVRLLEDHSLDDALLTNYLDANINPDHKYFYEFRYLDLVDTNNGNVYLRMDNGQKMQLYWPVPADAAADSDFYIVHFAGLHRDTNENMNDLLAQTPPEQIACEKVTLAGREYLRFAVSSFSPFALLYQKADAAPATPTPTPTAASPAPAATAPAQPTAVPSAAAVPTAVPQSNGIIPQTGDTFPIVPLVLLMLAALIGFGAIWLRKKKQQ